MAALPPNATRPMGPITTLLDLTNRDVQENDLFPINTDKTWFTRDKERRTISFSPLVQEIPFRGPAAFGQRFTFDLGSVLVGDLLFGAAVQIRLGTWFDAQTVNQIETGDIVYRTPSQGWEYANALGSIIIAEAELEIDGKTIEVIDGDFINVHSLLFAEYNEQFGVAYDHTGKLSITRLSTQLVPRVYPTEQGIIHCVLPFFFMRTRYQDALPMIAIKEGSVRLHITLRPFDECVRQLRGFRDNCTATPLEKTIRFVTKSVTTGVAPPEFQSLQLMTYGALLTGPLRNAILREPFEAIHREVQTFSFQEPLKYSVGKRGDNDTIRIILPLEANHPLEEIIWFVRRKGVRNNNEWTNYTSVLEREWNPRKAATVPLLVNAALQINGITVCDADEEYYRQLIANAHKGGAAAYQGFVYGYPVARNPGEHQPSGSMNASRTNSLRLILDVRPPGGVIDQNWEVKVFCIGLNWLRFQNGLANAVFTD